MDELIEYLNTATCIAFVGVGPSCELGLPDWKGLAKRVLDEIPNSGTHDLKTIRKYFDQGEFTRFFSEVAEILGQDALYAICKKALADPLSKGRVYSFLAKFPFQAYFTTNYDDVLVRHIRNTGVVPAVFLNRKSDFQTLDIDTFKKCVVKLHGDFSDPSSIVLTDEQYDSMESKDELNYFRETLSSYFRTKRFLILGHSVRDPHIQQILKRIAVNIRRSLPIYAVVADADTELIREWDRKYNIRVISYKNKSGTHEELAERFEAIEKYLSVDGEASPERADIDLRRTQSFYMWHKFQTGDKNLTIQIDSLKSVVLFAINKLYKPGEKFTVNKIEEKVNECLRSIIPTSYIKECLDSLHDEKFVQKINAEHYVSTSLLMATVDKYNQQYDLLQQVFDEQVKLDFITICEGISLDEVHRVQKAIRDLIIDLFSQRGIELTNMIFSQTPIGTARATNLFRMVNGRARDIQSERVRYKFISYVTKMISDPNSIQEGVLEYYSKAFVSMQALQVDPLGREFRQKFLTHRTLIVDSNVLIPLLAKHAANQNIFEQVLLIAKENEIRLITVDPILEEVRQHANWALDHVRRYGEQSEEVLSASLGRPPYKRNAFLDSYIRYSTDVKHIDFEAYVETLLGGRISVNDHLQMKINKEYGITLFDFAKIQEQQIDSPYVRHRISEFVKKKADELYLEKSDLRTRCEAEVYTVIRFWRSLKPADVPEDEWACSFLCQGSFLNRIARESEYPLEGNVVIKIDALYEFLRRFGQPRFDSIPFKDVMLSYYFRAAEYFVDKKKYRKFFGTLINEAERVYQEGMDNFKSYVNQNLMTDSIDEYSDLEKPVFVRGLQEELAKKIQDQQIEIGTLETRAKLNEVKLAMTEAELQKYKQKAEKREKYAEKQRRRKR